MRTKPPCTSDQYYNDGLCCPKCQKGKYVVAHCTESSETKCETCIHNTYAATSNALSNCLPCRVCDHSRQRESKPCAADSDRECECSKGFYCSEPSDQCHCISVTSCKLGYGVTAHPSPTSDTKCSPCPVGTFSNVTDYESPCRNHTSCKNLGRHLLTAGTSTSDAVCGDLIPQNNVTQKGSCFKSTVNCHWMIPAGLWAGLVITVIIIILGLVLRRWLKHRSRRAVIADCSVSFIPPVLPPDIIKHPGSPALDTFTHIDDPFTTGVHSSLECDGYEMSTMPMFEKYAHAHTHAMKYDPSMYHSEPQEDEWPGS